MEDLAQQQAFERHAVLVMFSSFVCAHHKQASFSQLEPRNKNTTLCPLHHLTWLCSQFLASLSSVDISISVVLSPAAKLTLVNISEGLPTAWVCEALEGMTTGPSTHKYTLIQCIQYQWILSFIRVSTSQRRHFTYIFIYTLLYINSYLEFK